MGQEYSLSPKMSINLQADFPIFTFFRPFSSDSHQGMLLFLILEYGDVPTSPVIIWLKKAKPSRWHFV